MWKLRLSLVLPLVQVAIFLCVFKWHVFYSSRIDWWTALNAPTLLLLDPLVSFAPIRWMPQRIIGLLPRDFIVLVGAIILWFCVGRTLDKIRAQNPPQETRRNTNASLVSIFLIACGIRLFVIGLKSMLPAFPRQQHPLAELATGLVTVVWSLGLILLPALKLLKRVRSGTSRPGPNAAQVP